MPSVDPTSQEGVTSTTTSSRFTDFARSFPSYVFGALTLKPPQMSHILEVLPPPDLSYPPDEFDLDRPILTWEASYMRTQITEDNLPTKFQDSNEELTSFLVIVDRFVPEKDGRRICTMCGYTLKVTSVVGLDDLQVLLDHLQQVHPRFWGKQPAGRV
jgi:hypothetical protein